MKKFLMMTCLSAAIAACGVMGSPGDADASGIKLFNDGDRYLKTGGRVQIQFHNEDPDTGGETSETNFRRLRTYFEAGLTKSLKAKFQFDLGKDTGDNDLDINHHVTFKDVYLQYTTPGGIKIKAGNAKIPFSREEMTSSKYQQLIERTFVGDHNYGTPAETTGVHVSGELTEQNILWGVSAGVQAIDPDDDKLDLDTPINEDFDFQQGVIFAGRVEFSPLGAVKFSQGDFKRESKYSVGAGAYIWKNDDSRNHYTTGGTDTSGGSHPDVDEIFGLEVSGAVRHKGISIDAEYNTFEVDTVDPSVTSGIYKNGSTALNNIAVEGGYMVYKDNIEVVAGYQIQDADNYADEWTRASIGANFFLKEHNLKLQTTYRQGENLKGKKGSDMDEIFIQAQYIW